MLANQLWIWQAKLVLRRQLGNCCMKKGVGYGGIVYVEPDGWIFYC